MPRGDGTGPPWGSGSAKGRSKGMGRMGGTKPGSGPGGECVCPACGKRTAHKRGMPCYNVPCPECGAKMIKA